MINTHPGRTLAAVAVVALVLLGIGALDTDGHPGPFRIIAGLGFIGFLLSVVVFAVLAVYVVATRRRRRRTL